MTMDNLSKDAMAAKLSGVSYGKWKAMQKPKEIKPKQTKRENEIICLCCGKVIVAKTKQKRKYCNVDCQKRYLSNKRWEERKKK